MTSRDCFGVLDHEILLGIMAEKIHDQRFLRLMRNMLKAGYLEDWEYHETLSGCPQGGVVSPVLSNIYLHKLDEFVEQGTDPAIHARRTPEGSTPSTTGCKARQKHARKRGDRAKARDLEKQLRTLPSRDPMDPGYRRLKYLKVRGRSHPGIHRAEGRSRGDQGQAGRHSSGRPSDWN